jgi:membrane protease YdiL (CAAX protease family)
MYGKQEFRGANKKERKENVIAIILSGIIAFLYISGIPSTLFVNIKVADVDPVSITIFINIILTLAVGISLVKILIPKFDVGFQSTNFKIGLKKYGVSCFIAFLIPCIAFIIGLYPFDYHPTLWKVLFEGIIYCMGVGLIEEFFCRGLLQNAIEGLLNNRKNVQLVAVLITALIFGLGHIFGMIGMPVLLASCKILWAVGLGIYFGAIYVLTKNLWLVALFHFVINLSGLPFSFSTQQIYPTISAIVVLISSLGFGLYGIYLLRRITPA